MSRKLLIAVALLAMTLFSPLGGAAQANAHPWGAHGHFVGHVHGHFVGHVRGHFAFRHPFFRGHRFAAARFGRFGWGWRGGWGWWHGGWGWGWGWRSAWWWYPWWQPYPVAYGAPTHLAYHPVHRVAAPACTCACCR
ncbi:MAG TPA: hypothetical protein VGR91_07000 [Stellaceae bacterium]|nr:hypothetical protein [Stellaceae bacterium]